MPEVTGAQVRTGIMTTTTNRGQAGYTLPPQQRTLTVPGRLTYAQIREFRNDPTVKLARTFVVAPALIAGWSVESDEDVPADIVEFIRGQMMPLHDHIMRTGLLGLIDWGWQPFEKVFDIVDAPVAMPVEGEDPPTVPELGVYVGIKKLKPLLQDMTYITVDRNTGALTGLLNGVNERGQVRLQIEDTLVLYQNVEGTNWYGESDLIAIYLLMAKYKRIESAADKYDAKVAGAHWIVHYPVGKSPYGATGELTDNYLIALALLGALEASGSVVIPSQVQAYIGDLSQIGKENDAWRIEILSASGTSSTDMLDRMRYLDTLKVRAFCVPERAILEGKYGTKAEADEHGDFATVNINLRRNDITREVNWHLVNQLLRINFGRQYENKVRLVPNPINDEALARNAKLLDKILFAKPEMLDMIDIDAIFEQLKTPVRESEDAIDKEVTKDEGKEVKIAE